MQPKAQNNANPVAAHGQSRQHAPATTMISQTTPITFYHAHREAGQRPALLESRGIRTHFGKRTILGVKPSAYLEVRDGQTYRDGRHVGDASTLMDHLALPKQNRFFPAWIGFFCYEFARHLQLPTKSPMTSLPEAAFFLFDEGYYWEDDQLCEEPRQLMQPLAFQPADIRQVELHCDFTREDFLSATRQIQERIKSGDVYQVNLSQRFHFDSSGIDPLSIYAQLAQSNPSPFMGIIENKDWSIISGSPERLFDRRGTTITTRPIAGTRARGATKQEDIDLERELVANTKERAEHAMLVDLLRNDLAKVSTPGSTSVSEAFSVERYSHVMHLVSQVQSQSTASLSDVFRAIFPGGTITGTPKESAMKCIAELEPVPRGVYTGSIGYVSSGYGSDFNILIRSLVMANNVGYLSTGAGIVIGSDPEKEYEETQQKAQSLRHVLKCAKAGAAVEAPHVTSSWSPPCADKQFHARVIFVENHDSFSFNIIDYLRVLGCDVRVVDHHETPDTGDATHIVLGPGPGEPQSSGQLMKWLDAAMTQSLPLLGICLGHQALGLYCGARLTRALRPIHGEAHILTHTGQGLFAQVNNPIVGTRYHSLSLTQIPIELDVHAWSDDDQVMAIAHKTKPAFGVQYHPESFLSSEGLELLQNFLTIGASRYER